MQVKEKELEALSKLPMPPMCIDFRGAPFSLKDLEMILTLLNTEGAVNILNVEKGSCSMFEIGMRLLAWYQEMPRNPQLKPLSSQQE